MKRGNRVIEIISALIKTPNGCRECLADKFIIEHCDTAVKRHGRRDFQSVQESARVAVGEPCQNLLCLIGNCQSRILALERPIKQLQQIVFL